MKILAISGSMREASTNMAMLRAVADIARPDHQVAVFSGIASLPIFSPDHEGEPLPGAVQGFVEMVQQNDGLLISSPEYVRAIPGGLKNAIDWLVSRNEIISKPIALMHASHRGDDMLAQLRLVLATISERFAEELFLRFELMKFSPEKVSEYLSMPRNHDAIVMFLREFDAYCAENG